MSKWLIKLLYEYIVVKKYRVYELGIGHDGCAFGHFHKGDCKVQEYIDKVSNGTRNK